MMLASVGRCVRVALAALLCSCSVGLDIPSTANVTCASDKDCPSGNVCDGRQKCVDLAQAAAGVPGFDISPTTLTVAETGSSSSFSVRLTAQPSATVTLVLAADDATEATISQNILTFTTADWGNAKTVTVTGVPDCIADGPIVSHVLIAPAQSDDPNYSGVDPDDIDVTTNDDKPPAGITVTPTSGLVTDETGATAQFTVTVACQPTADIHFTLTSSDTTEGTIAITDMTFTTAAWSAPQVVVVSGQGDCANDGNIPYTIVLGPVESDDPLYNGIDPPDVALVNDDVTSSRINVSPQNGLVTSESGGNTSFAVVLTCAPSASVMIPLSVSDTTEGSLGSVTSLTFTSANWSSPQSVIVTGVDDTYADGAIAYTVVLGTTTSSDDAFNGLDPPDVSVTNDDNDTASVTVTPLSGLMTTESGGTATFTVKLGATPLQPVHITVTSSNTAEGTVSPSELVITTESAATVTITGVNDDVADGDQAYTIVLGTIVSADPAFNGLDVHDVAVVNQDNDTAGFTFFYSEISPPVYVVSEAGTQTTVGLQLSSKPLADVVVTCAGDTPTEAKVGASNSASLTFTAANWNALQSFAVVGVDDGVPNSGLGTSHVSCTTSTADPKYQNLYASPTIYTTEPSTSKRVYATAATYNGAQVAPAAADAACGTGYKALVATVAARHPGGSDWVLAANKTYYWSDGHGVMGTTNGSAIFTTVLNGGPYGGDYWTGIDANFLVNSNCADWTNATSVDTGTSGSGGDGADLGAAFDGFIRQCQTLHGLLCFEQ